MIKEFLTNEQVFLQMLFKKNEKMLQIISEDEMLKEVTERLQVQVKELQANIKSAD